MLGITFNQVLPGDRPKADDENALRRQVEALSNIQGPGLKSFGNHYRRSAPPSGSTGQSAQIKFQILDWLPGDPLTSPCEAVYAVVTQVSCGSSVQVGDEVIVWDPDLCWFDLPTSLLIGMKGSANLMRTNTLGLPTMPPMCFTPPEDECSWVVENMCCSEQIYE